MLGKEGMVATAGNQETQQTQRNLFASQENCSNVPVQEPADHHVLFYSSKLLALTEHASPSLLLPLCPTSWQVLAHAPGASISSDTSFPEHKVAWGFTPNRPPATLILEMPVSINHIHTRASGACER